MSQLPAFDAKLPGGQDLHDRLVFRPADGHIRLDGERMLLLHLSAFASMRRMMIDEMGMEGARRVLTRAGYVAGLRDAELALRLRGGGSILDAFSVGPQLHALEGNCRVEPVRLEMDRDRGHFYGEFLWWDSAEDSAHIQEYDVGDEPTCWMQVGYASGYTTGFMGFPVFYREVECRSQSDACCRIVGMPEAAWDPGTQEVFRAPSAPASVRETPLVGHSAGFLASLRRLEQVAPTDTSALLLGETGVGKGVHAKYLHSLSTRNGGPFVALNCAALPESLLEAELFGVVRGAFTGAVEARPGRFERAHGGTLFLDEIGAMPLGAQAKLLRALQEGEIERVGDTRTRTVDVRVVAATNADLRRAVDAGTFRRDLFYRVGVFPVRIPPLRERRDDVPALVHHFVVRYGGGRDYGGLTGEARDALFSHDFPGNVRELENMVQRALVLTEAGQPFDVHHLFDQAIQGEPPKVRRGGRRRERPAADDWVSAVLGSELSFDAVEERLLRAALAQAEGNVAEAARRLGLSRAQVAYRLQKHGIDGGQV